MRNAHFTDQYAVGSTARCARLALLGILTGCPSQFLYAQIAGEPEVGDPVVPQIFKGDLRNLASTPVTPQSATCEAPMGVGIPLRPQIVLPVPKLKGVPDELFLRDNVRPIGAAGVTPREFSTPNPNFSGISNIDGVVPADPVGAVGRNHFIQMVNVSFQIFDKRGDSLAGPLNINSLWNGFGGACQDRNNGDPYVLYDHLADRWVLSQFAVPNGFS